MACANCGLGKDAHNGVRSVYVRGAWVECEGYEVADSVAAAVSSNGGATMKKLYEDTKAFRDRSVRDAEAKARKVGKW